MKHPELTARVLEYIQRPEYRPVKPRVIAKKLELNEDDRHALRAIVKRLIKAGKVTYGANHLVEAVRSVAESSDPSQRVADRRTADKQSIDKRASRKQSAKKRESDDDVIVDSVAANAGDNAEDQTDEPIVDHSDGHADDGRRQDERSADTWVFHLDESDSLDDPGEFDDPDDNDSPSRSESRPKSESSSASKPESKSKSRLKKSRDEDEPRRHQSKYSGER
ncbi:MAG TPA: hypothetical protein PLV92_29505, partial [Pirellulaceae bacterium]|nr:hypothetical protein [Pirellulaceae bacterium]